MIEQKCTIQQLIKILDKITLALGFGHVLELKVGKQHEFINYVNTAK